MLMLALEDGLPVLGVDKEQLSGSETDWPPGPAVEQVVLVTTSADAIPTAQRREAVIKNDDCTIISRDSICYLPSFRK
jgi:hypothetical protein